MNSMAAADPTGHKHEHVDPPGYQRHRPKFLKRGLEKHGLEKVIWR